MANIELLEKTLQHIEENEQGWNQRHWRNVPGLSEGAPELLPTVCGTAMCFAGEAIQLNDPTEWVVTPQMIKEAKEAGDKELMFRLDAMLEYTYSDPREGTLLRHPVTREDIYTKRASTRGREVLDLDYDTAETLFYEDNKLYDLKAAVEHIKEHGDLDSWVRPSYYDEDEDD